MIQPLKSDGGHSRIEGIHLHLYPDTTEGLINQQHRQPNLSIDIVHQPAKFVREGGSGEPSEAVT